MGEVYTDDMQGEKLSSESFACFILTFEKVLMTWEVDTSRVMHVYPLSLHLIRLS